ncbi:glycoside hydrolase family 10 protein [Microbulbifer agarilyticus]|uniref:glycoside hydrolase family 10 protein n=1 Tax=Microbulbifer agarilyticus TaxID=260552 RepID=UPI001CD7C873|nr:family 10 glycosylhydrolase [Microbulbifer agarilyticus]MCA0892845.1 family 10 glycosylhydrolase [Microbulbifer agarilyticus]
MTLPKKIPLAKLLNRWVYPAVIAVMALALWQYPAWFGQETPKQVAMEQEEQEELPDYGRAERETVAREFRAAWVATVANIDWPSEPGLPVAQQQQEAIALLDKVAAANMNAVIFQVRPQADALYASELEPWSYYLSGEQGKAPEPFYDPLAFWIEQAHQRGLELHAWVNPYRAHHTQGGPVSAHSIVNTKPELVAKLANGMYWMEPTREETISHSLSVITDIVQRYDIDGIHYDDYFYPYPSYNEGAPFPDRESYATYQQQGGQLGVSDWRRAAVNRFVKDIYSEVKRIKPHVKVGISPFGIWRPKYPETIAGFDQHEQLYADARLWLNEGWLDYFTPQLYWNINRVQQSYPMLLAWWQGENHQQRHLWPGLSSNQVETNQGTDEIINQILFTRALLQEQTGQVFWNVKTVSENPKFAQLLKDTVFYHQALVPASPWLDSAAPQAPEVRYQSTADGLSVNWQPRGDEAAARWLLYYQAGGKWHYRIFTKDVLSHQFRQQDEVTTIAVVAVDRNGLESERIDQQITYR